MLTRGFSTNSKYSKVEWGQPSDRVFNTWKVPDGMLETFLKILEENNVDLEKVRVTFYGPR